MVKNTQCNLQFAHMLGGKVDSSVAGLSSPGEKHDAKYLEQVCRSYLAIYILKHAML